MPPDQKAGCRPFALSFCLMTMAWGELEKRFLEIVDRQASGGAAHSLDFARGRLREGRELGEFFSARFEGTDPIRTLDIGAGNGGVAAALSTTGRFEATALDVVPNPEALELRKHAPFHYVAARGGALPFPAESFDLVLLLETIEHVADVRSLGAEIMRVLRPGGYCMITTPARLRHLTAPDPHYGIRFLLMLPDRAQELVATRLLRAVQIWEVEHIYWSVAGVVRHFPFRRRVETLVNIPPPGIPKGLRQRTWYLLRWLLWDRIVIQSGRTGELPPVKRR